MIKKEKIILNNIELKFKLRDKFIHVIDKLSFSVMNNEFISIIGPSGCGKTTILKLIGGLYSKNNKNLVLNGEILINGNDPEIARKNKEFGFVFQNPVLLPWRNILDNVKLANEIIRKENEKNDKFYFNLINMMGLEDFRNAYPHELSKGMQQRVSLARTMSFNPSILLMDEPFGALDEINRDKLNLEVLKIWRKTKATIVFVTHNLSEAVFLSDKVIVLSDKPSKLKEIVRINLNRPRKIEMRESTYFTNYVSLLRKNISLLDK